METKKRFFKQYAVGKMTALWEAQAEHDEAFQHAVRASFHLEVTFDAAAFEDALRRRSVPADVIAHALETIGQWDDTFLRDSTY